VPSKSPEGLESWQSNEVLVILYDIFGGALEEEVDFDVTSGCHVTQNASALVVVSNHWRLSVGVSEENTHEFRSSVCLNQQKWMDSVGLLESVTVIVGSFLTISPHSPGSFAKFELSDSLTEAKQVLRWKDEVHLDEFVGHVESRTFCTDQIVSGHWLLEREREWVSAELKLLHF